MEQNRIAPLAEPNRHLFRYSRLLLICSLLICSLLICSLLVFSGCASPYIESDGGIRQVARKKIGIVARLSPGYEQALIFRLESTPEDLFTSSLVVVRDNKAVGVIVLDWAFAGKAAGPILRMVGEGIRPGDEVFTSTILQIPGRLTSADTATPVKSTHCMIPSPLCSKMPCPN